MRATVAELVSKCDGVWHSANWHYNTNESKPKKRQFRQYVDAAAGRRRDATFIGVSASMVPQTLAAITHPFSGRWPAIPVVSTIEPSLRIWELPYLTAASAAQ